MGISIYHAYNDKELNINKVKINNLLYIIPNKMEILKYHTYRTVVTVIIPVEAYHQSAQYHISISIIQIKGQIYHVSHLLYKIKIGIAKYHICHTNSRGDYPDQFNIYAVPDSTQYHIYDTFHTKKNQYYQILYLPHKTLLITATSRIQARHRNQPNTISAIPIIQNKN